MTDLLALGSPQRQGCGMAMYRNPLRTLRDVDGWVAEGPHAVEETPEGLVLSSAADAHWVLWCPEVFGDRITVTWEFSPRKEPGLAMLFVGATSLDGGDVLDASLAPRTGVYNQYHSSDIRTLHASYFRRRYPEERAFHVANLRKSPGAHLVAQGGDPLPSVGDADAFYRMELIKDGADVSMSINDLPLWGWCDDESTGPRVRAGASVSVRCRRSWLHIATSKCAASEGGVSLSGGAWSPCHASWPSAMLRLP